MILILVVEVAYLLGGSWALWYTWRRWCVAERRRKQHQAEKRNGYTGFGNRLRSTREWDRFAYQLNFLIVGALLLVWRVQNLDRPPAVLASLIAHYPLFYGSSWAFRQTLKDLKSEAELREMNDHEQQHRLTGEAIQASAQSVVAMLGEMKDQAAKDKGEV